MKMRSWMLAGLFAAGAMVGVPVSEVIHAQAPGLATKQIFRTDLANIPGQEVLFFKTDWAPGQRLPWHIHPEGHEFVYVIEGEQTFEIEGVGTRIVKAGEVIHNPPNVAHFGRNDTNQVSKTLVVRIKDKDKPITVEVSR
jgi:quercetin dioxygenase-like cupin family protein